MPLSALALDRRRVIGVPPWVCGMTAARVGVVASMWVMRRSDGFHPVLMFTAVALALLMSSLDQTIVATALHALQEGLDAPITWAGWTITAYSLGMVLMLSLAGRLSERYGRRRVFLISAGVFTTASLCCGLAGNIYVLVALRFIQALGGAGFTPSATGIIVDHFGAARDKAVGLFGSIFPIGAMTGPIFGGLFVDYWTWRGIFFVNVPIGILLVVLCLRYVPPDERTRPAGSTWSGCRCSGSASSASCWRSTPSARVMGSW